MQGVEGVEEEAQERGYAVMLGRTGAKSAYISPADPAAEPWLPQPAGWGTHSIELQQQDPASPLALVTKALNMRRLPWKTEVFGRNDGGTWRVEAGNLLICERSADFFVAVAMGTEPVHLPPGSVLPSAEPLA